jgi:hypothetical protein
MTRRVLVMACSARKQSRGARALELYKSRQHTFALAAWLRDPHLFVAILSAKYGYVRASDWIEPYEQLMTPERAAELEHDERAYTAFRLHVVTHQAATVMVYGGELYRGIIRAWCVRLGRPCIELVGENRGCGDHYRALKEALR